MRTSAGRWSGESLHLNFSGALHVMFSWTLRDDVFIAFALSCDDHNIWVVYDANEDDMCSVGDLVIIVM